MTLVLNQCVREAEGRRATAFNTAAADPGLFDHPDRALDSLRTLACDLLTDREWRLDRLARLLRDDAGARFWTEAGMREYAGLVNALLDGLGVRITTGRCGPSRLGVKTSNRPGGRYALFRFRNRPRGEEWCSRDLPAGLSLGEGPG